MGNIDDLMDEFDTGLSDEQRVRLALSVEAIRSNPDATDVNLRNFVDSIATYVLTGDKVRG